ncbi:MAG TPA: pyruvate carboxylase subunit B [bacterium]|nr:pyruvate carboxylase subunit B [bacterium]
MAKKEKKDRRHSVQEARDMSAGKKGGAKNPVRIMDTTLRDGHQSMLATRLRMEDMLPILDMMDRAGFAALEVWGGATFDTTTRFLNEDPWERLSLFKKHMPKTPLQMLLRGQNLVGYRHYADDVVDAFVEHSAATGIDIFRVFDALNDERNMQRSFAAIKKTKKHVQGTICYSLTERRLGGPIYNTKYFLDKARIMEDMGADSLCLKDMAGMLAPPDAYELITALKSEVKIPIQLHTHYTSGMGSMTYLKAVEAGVDAIDCALAPLALRTSQPAVEPILVALEGSDRDPGIDLNLLIKCGEHLEKVSPKYRDCLDATRMSVIDAGVLLHQIPGGMLSNLVSQLREAGALDKLHEVFEELPRTRADLGYPPLVTPSSQIVGTQAVMNVLFGRYRQVTQPVKDYAAGLYGRPPAPVDPEVRKICLKDYKYKTPITGRPADLLPPEMEKARAAVKDITKEIGDILTYALYPTTGMKYLRWKHGLEAPPPEVMPKTLEQCRCEMELMEKAKKGLLVETPAKKEAPAAGPDARTFNVFIEGEYFQVVVDPADGKASVQPAAGPSAKAPAPSAARPAGPSPKPAPAAPAASCTPGAVLAPMPGIVIEYRVKQGDAVKQGQVLLILEAMKMQNEIKAPAAGKAAGLGFKPGDRVQKGDVLLVVE